MVAPHNGAADSPLIAVSEEAQRALRERPTLSIRARLTVALLVWFGVSLGMTVVSMILIGRVQAKLHTVWAVERYTFEIQQARRFEKNYFLYHTNLDDALEQVWASQGILRQEWDNMAAVVGGPAVEAMDGRVQRYEELLSGLRRLDLDRDVARLDEIEAELRVHGAEMVNQAEELATRERRSVEALLLTSQRVTVGFLAGIVVLIVLLAAFVLRQVFAPLQRMIMHTRRIAEGDLTPITPRRKYNDEFSELASGINYMLHELVRRQQLLVQAHKLQAVGTLTAGVAHELNNPINNLMLTAVALQEDYADLDDRERIEMASDLVSQSERARDIVRNLLDFARESEVELAPIVVEQLIAETLQLASNQVKLARAKVQGEVEENLPPVYGDRHQLIQVFLNLVLNALDAMPGGGTLSIAVEASEDGDFVDIHVADTGMGIPDEHMALLFRPFFSTKHHAKGTGLGLSVSLGIIEQHGGIIRVKSQVGQGTVFTVSLPITKVPAAINDLAAMVPAGASLPPDA